MRQPHADGRDAQTADLYQNCNDSLPEQAERVAGVHHDQPGHTDGARCGKQRVQRADVCAGVYGKRQHQQRRAQQNQQRKAHGNDARRGLIFQKSGNGIVYGAA